MGNGGNSALITLNSPNVFYPGDQVSGTVQLEIPKPIDITAILIRFTAKEYVHWSEQRTSGSGKHRRTHSVHFYGGHEMFNLEFPIQEVAVSGFVGQFAFPFVFTLPHNIPGSFLYEGAATGSITYKLKAVVNRASMFKSDIKNSISLNVLSRPQGIPKRINNGTRESVYVCCCCNKGEIDIQCRCECDEYKQGQEIVIFANITNDANMSVKGVVAELISHITLFSHSGKQRNIAKVVAACDVLERPLDRGQSLLNVLKVAVPAEAVQEVSGRAVRHKYYVRIRTRVNWASDPHVDLPVGVFANYFQGSGGAFQEASVIVSGIPVQYDSTGFPVHAPSNWQPQQAAVIRIVLPETMPVVMAPGQPGTYAGQPGTYAVQAGTYAAQTGAPMYQGVAVVPTEAPASTDQVQYSPSVPAQYGMS
jgi:hypothetical protein